MSRVTQDASDTGRPEIDCHPDDRIYREIVENSNLIILKMDNDGRIFYFNRYAEEVFGFKSDEIMGQSVIGTIVPETESSGRNLAEMIRSIVKSPHLYTNNENENIRKNGERVWISWNNRALTGADGQNLGVLSIGQDISHRHKMELALQKSEERFRSFVENANDVVFALTPDGLFSYVSPQWKAAFGYEIEETVGHPFVPFVHPDDVQGCFEFLQKVMATGQKQSGIAYRVRCKDGRYLWYKANGSLIHDPEYNSYVFIGIGRDITEKKIAEESLRQSEERFSAAFHASPDAIVLSRLSDGVLIDVNEGFEHFTGYAKHEVIGKSTLELGLWQNPDVRRQLAQDMEKSGQINNREVQFWRKDGSTLVGHLSGRVIQINGEACLLTIARDVTENEYLQQELIKAQKLESISVLAGGIAHNFNNVLTGVIGYISYARKHLSDPDKILPILESAEKSSYRAAGLARQLLTFSRGGTPVRKPVPVHDLIQESVSLFLTGTNVKGEISDAVDRLILVDCQQINQAFNNIIINAVHAMPQGGTLVIREESTVLPDGNKYALSPGSYVKIEFRDSGCGIPKGDLIKVFDPYFTTKESGTGLGLSTTLSIISKHSGHIDIASEVGKGTTVTILLPAAAETEKVTHDTGEKGRKSLSGVSLLVMDDEEMIRELVFNLLSELGCDVTTCESGESAVELYETSRKAGRAYSVAVLDLLIPGGIGGIETARRILQIDPEACLLVSSGYSDDPAISDFSRYGFCGSISKPYNSEQLEHAVAEVLAAKA